MEQLDRCANCGSVIGSLETPYVWGESTVCAACHKKLSSQLQGRQQPIRVAAAPVKVKVSGWITTAAVILVLFFLTSMTAIFSKSILSQFRHSPKSSAIDATDQLKIDQLVEAAKNLDVDRVKDVLAQEPDVNGEGRNHATAIQAMASNAFSLAPDQASSFRDILSMLTKRGADVNKLDGAGQTALFSAMASPEAVKALLAAGAKANITDNFGRTPLFAYCDPSSIGMVVDAGANVRAVDNDGETALHNAARLGDIGMVRAIAERNADLNRPNNKGQTPLKLAELGFRDDIIAYLKGRGAKD